MRLLMVDGKCNICGERVRLARDRQELSQEQLAAKIQLNGHALTQKAIRLKWDFASFQTMRSPCWPTH